MAHEPTKQVAPKTDDPPRKHGGVAWPLWVLMLFAFVYFLSIGPVLKLSAGTRASYFAWSAYDPLFFCTGRCPPLEACLDSYLHAWRVKNPRDYYD